jgi:tyrosine-protein phosphatase OCA1
MLPDDLPRHFATWLDDQGTRCVHLGESMQMRSPWKPVPEDVIIEGLSILLDPSNYPLAVMCSLGMYQTGTLIGCLRKLQGWNLASIIDEYRRYAGSKHRQLNEQFIELFDIDLVDIPLNPPRFLHIPNAAATAGGNELGRSAGAVSDDMARGPPRLRGSRGAAAADALGRGPLAVSTIVDRYTETQAGRPVNQRLFKDGFACAGGGCCTSCWRCAPT